MTPFRNIQNTQRADLGQGQIEAQNNWHQHNGNTIPLHRIPRVNNMGPLLEVTAIGHKDEVDQELEHFATGAKTILAVFLMTLILIVGVLIVWNLKNALGIDIFPGEHHDLIDQANHVFGI
jgi:hypothetical protein